jgi:hypothetical protein
MRINEILSENQLDELNLAGAAGKAAGWTAGAVGAAKKGIQGARGAFNQGFQAGKARWDAPKGDYVDPLAAGDNSQQDTDVPGQQASAPQGQPQTGTQPTTQQPQQQQPAGIGGQQIAGELGKVWNKFTADQANKTSSPQVRQQIISMAKQAGLTGQRIESRVQFPSRFLGIDI